MQHERDIFGLKTTRIVSKGRVRNDTVQVVKCVGTSCDRRRTEISTQTEKLLLERDSRKIFSM